MLAALDPRNGVSVLADGVAQAFLPAKSAVAGTEACATWCSSCHADAMTGGLSQ